MPFRTAHYWLLALLPVIVLAFWPLYFGRLGQASFAQHVHGITASVWILLCLVQSWTIAARRPAAHRTAGLAMFAVVPAFSAAGFTAMHEMAGLGLTAADPFHAAHGVALAMMDLTALLAFLVLVGWAVARRRDVFVHGGAMMGTVLLVLPPVTGRLMQHVPGFGRLATPGFDAFDVSFHLAQWGSALACVWLARRQTRAARPLHFVALVSGGSSLLYFGARGWGWWRDALAAGIAVPMPAYALAGAAGALAMLWLCWRSGERRRPVSRPVLSPS